MSTNEMIAIAILFWLAFRPAETTSVNLRVNDENYPDIDGTVVIQEFPPFPGAWGW